ncbi:hypothetical protein MSAN_02456600 [Mycena sanguinolenta]|uniref:Metallo-dependent hydrolase n=1 Tax=Mycena sanguinolenta TaxID=230812 RepID=A0A8H7CC04_9AGAR|nr:hypothetical protein MSAN_02456600 [Mycena sanguinolenta]
MGKNNKKKAAPPPESLFHILHPASSSASRPIVDTHMHLASTFEAHRAKYPSGEYTTVYDFVRRLYAPAGNLPMLRCATRRERRGGEGVVLVRDGVHPHEARLYDGAVEADILGAMTHPALHRLRRNRARLPLRQLPRPVQQAVFARQLRHAVCLGKPLTVHMQEADEDTERILKEEVSREHKIHIHCFTDSPAFAQRQLDWFQNLYIGITGASLLPRFPLPSSSSFALRLLRSRRA